MVSTEQRVNQRLFRVRNYDLAATLDSGQAFRWKPQGTAWTGVIGRRWVRLTRSPEGIVANVVSDPDDWKWLEDYLQTNVDLDLILRQLPGNPLLDEAVRSHCGLRLLRQEPWECLASFILSSTKQVAHIKRIVDALCRQHGDPVKAPVGEPRTHAFPGPDRIASLDESKLRALSMGFRAPYLLQAARRVASGRLQLDQLRDYPLHEARAALMDLAGVGRKIADCVLLFALGFDEAFPVDIWVMRALRSAWFGNQAVTLPQLVSFSAAHFGPYGGYAQQYLFHHVRSKTGSSAIPSAP